jgi:hypothetical protein
MVLPFTLLFEASLMLYTFEFPPFLIRTDIDDNNIRK